MPPLKGLRFHKRHPAPSASALGWNWAHELLRRNWLGLFQVPDSLHGVRARNACSCRARREAVTMGTLPCVAPEGAQGYLRSSVPNASALGWNCLRNNHVRGIAAKSIECRREQPGAT